MHQPTLMVEAILRGLLVEHLGPDNQLPDPNQFAADAAGRLALAGVIVGVEAQPAPGTGDVL